MTTEETNIPPNERLSKKEAQDLVDQVDEHTIFLLAGLMIDLHMATSLREQHVVINSALKAGVLMKNNPGFVARFKKAHLLRLEQLKALQGHGQSLIDAAEHRVPTARILSDRQVEEMAKAHANALSKKQ